MPCSNIISSALFLTLLNYLVFSLSILSVPDEGHSRNVPDEGHSRNVPDEGHSRNVPDEGYSRNESCTLKLISSSLFSRNKYGTVQYLVRKKHA